MKKRTVGLLLVLLSGAVLGSMPELVALCKAQGANNALLLRKLDGVTDRRAHFTCCVALIAPDGAEHVVEGRCFGTIARTASGEGGFGYDPLFVPDGHSASFAALSAAEKNAISHRGRALAEVKRVVALSA